MNLYSVSEKKGSFFRISTRNRFLSKKPLARSIIKIMRISIVTATLLITTSAQLLFASPVNSQTLDQVSVLMGLENETLVQAFQKIESQSPFYFMYRKEDVRHFGELNVKSDKRSVAQFLKIILSGTGLTYRQVNNQVLILSERRSDRGVMTGITASPTRMEYYSLFNTLIRGRVTNAGGEPLIGVSVTVKGTGVGTSTDEQGNYAIDVPNNGVLVFSYVGFEKKEISISGQSSVNIILESGTSELEQVVVVGYGTQKKRDLTGSVSSIKGDEVTQLPTQRVDQALQGRAAGIMVLNTDGAPGGNTTIRVRGINSVNGNNSALIVIDGLQGGDLMSLNPGDIESIEVLKDASATAIYGSQGANGVILITTKAGKKGKPVITYNYDLGTATMAKKMPLLNAADYARNINAIALSKNGGGINPQPIFSESEISAFEKNGGTDWQDVIYRNATTQNHQLSVSGGTDRLNYRISGAYLDQQGILLNSAYKRFSLRANLKADITDWASFSINWDGAKEKTNSVLFGNTTDWPNNPIGAATRFSPTVSVYNEDGTYSRAALRYGNPTLWNPMASAVEPESDNSTVRNNANAFLDFKILNGLSLRISGGAMITNQNNLGFYNTKTFIGMQGNGSGSQYAGKSEFYQNSNILTYDRNFSKHRLTFTGVVEQKYFKDYYSTIDASDFLNQQTNVNDFSGANIKTIGSSYTDRVINSYLGRVNYVFDDKYLLTASYRADGSSVFGKNNKWGYFPSVALAWRASEENFIQNLNVFTDLKIRGSWGVTGSQAIQPYQTLARIVSGSNYPYDGGDASNIGFDISSAANPFLKWESTEQLNVGVDISVLNGRLTFTGDYYNKTTRDLLMPRGLPAYTGLRSIIDNVGSMRNRGVELALGADPVSEEDFKWHTAIQASFNRTTVLNLGQDKRIGYRAGGSGQGTNNPFMFLVVGEPFGQMYGWKYLGVWSTKEAQEAAEYGQLPGDPHYFDKDGDKRINIKDTTVIGNSMPKCIFGWSNQITFKNFVLSFLIQGTQGNNIFNVARIALDAADGTSERLLNRWAIDNQTSDIPGIIDARTREQAALVNKISFPSSSGNTLSRYVEDGSYFRLKNITLAYNIPSSVLRNIKFSGASIYVSSMNLVTITNYTGYDPEVSSYRGNDAQLGSDYNNYPSSRTINIGLKVSF